MCDKHLCCVSFALLMISFRSRIIFDLLFIPFPWRRRRLFCLQFLLTFDCLNGLQLFCTLFEIRLAVFVTGRCSREHYCARVKSYGMNGFEFENPRRAHAEGKTQN
jgi:hypothetical protein